MPGLRDRLLFDAARGRVLDGPRRYLLMRHDVLMGMFDRLPADVRALALDAIAQSVAEHGADSIRAYHASGGGDVAALLAVTADAAADLGWGRWRFACHDSACGPVLSLTVDDSPFAAVAARGDAPVCAPVRGMLGAVAEVAFGAPYRVRERRCAAQGAPRCEFDAHPRSAA